MSLAAVVQAEFIKPCATWVLTVAPPATGGEQRVATVDDADGGDQLSGGAS
jgi:hypothetical protein